MTYPLEFREKVMEVKSKYGLTYQQAAERFCMGKDTLTRWHKCLEPKQSKDRPSIKLDIAKSIYLRYNFLIFKYDLSPRISQKSI